ncbi:MAG: T9SS type A sorting domain-containing protein [Bacteroidetes bacterium]|nr:T9SS type A sorting domain-containing protein [Bacteroidota bacterium]
MYKIILALLPLCTQAQSLHIASGKIYMTGASNLVLSDMSLVNDGGFIATLNSMVQFRGASTAPVNVGGTGSSSFYFLQLLRPLSSDLFLSGDITVTGILTLNQGRIQLNRHTLDLSTTGSLLGENNTSYITGTTGGRITATRSFPSATPQNPGNIGLQMTQTGAPTSNYTIARQHYSETVTSGGIVSIQRSFSISSGATGPINLHLRFFYNDVDIFDNDENQMVFWNGSTVPFTQLGKDSNNAVANWVDLNNIHTLGHFVLAMPNTGGGATMGARPGLAQSTTQSTTGDQPTLTTQVKVYPNPVRDAFTVELSVTESKTRTFELFDPSGRLLQKKEIYCPAGRNTIPWSLGATAPGVYFLVVDHGSLKNIRIVKE